VHRARAKSVSDSTCKVVGQSATQIPNFANTSRSSTNSTFPNLSSSTRRKLDECQNLPLQVDKVRVEGRDTVRPDLSPRKAPGRNRLSCLLLLNPVQLFLLLAEVVSFACIFKFRSDNYVRSQILRKKPRGRGWEANTVNKKPGKKGLKIRKRSGPTPVARGGCGAKAPPLAARPN